MQSTLLCWKIRAFLQRCTPFTETAGREGGFPNFLCAIRYNLQYEDAQNTSQDRLVGSRALPERFTLADEKSNTCAAAISGDQFSANPVSVTT
jgi:hypothetical protein